ncbi:MAG: alpha-amylase [Bacteroidetes bacterium]|nr:MAG: alpha-amylase [Bacteroidota bacterium]
MRTLTVRLIVVIVICLSSDIISGQTPIVINPPSGTLDGINILSGTSVILQLRAPGKQYVHVRGDFNSYTSDANSLMNISQDGNIYWLQIDGLSPGNYYKFYYRIDGVLDIADPYSELILDPWDDGFIPPNHFPGMPQYPTGQATMHVSTFRTDSPYFLWTDYNYQKPSQDKLVIYECLVRDFDSGGVYQDLINRLDYLEYMGFNALELMPINEFEGNLSWGYNPNFRFAPDKYYGTKAKLKELVNKCHERGISVIMDVVPNHSFGTDPLVRLYQDSTGQVTANNPWFNSIATHPFSPGYDFNHESTWVREYWKRVFDFWLTEYHIDGYRVDLSKGLTQVNSGNNVNLWNQYDQSRINILFDYWNDIQANHPGTYVILEHLGNNDEEKVLADGGFMIWGKMTYDFAQSAMGYSGDMNYGSWQNRGYNWPNLVTYMESHDEERIAYDLQLFGNSSGGYDTKSFATSMDRLKMTNAFLLTIPGPKMIWQWSELGYDLSIFDCGDGTYSESCKLSEKNERWTDLEVPERLSLAKTISALTNLKQSQPCFSSYDFNMDCAGTGKLIHLFTPNQNAVLIGNFDVVPLNIVPGFPHTGTWYDYFSGAITTVSDLTTPMSFSPGEWHLYLDTQLPTPDTNGLFPILTSSGCTDSLALNYDPTAVFDNGTCQYSTTLRLDMGNIIVSPDGPHVAGSFQNWSPLTSPLVLDVDGTYYIDVIGTVGAQIDYKFINGIVWAQEESVPSSCGNPNGLGGYNRYFIVDPNVLEVPIHCFSECLACGDPGFCGPGTYWDVITGFCLPLDIPLICNEDLNGDGYVAVGDLLMLLSAFGSSCP